jgi:hypothetical protein
MTSRKKLKKRIEELDQERTALLKAHQTITDIYWIKGTKQAKRRATIALDEAGKRENNRQIAGRTEGARKRSAPHSKLKHYRRSSLWRPLSDLGAAGLEARPIDGRPMPLARSAPIM